MKFCDVVKSRFVTIGRQTFWLALCLASLVFGTTFVRADGPTITVVDPPSAVASGSSASTVNTPVTVTYGANCLVVLINNMKENAAGGWTVTWNGQALTGAVVIQSGSTGAKSAVYYLYDPVTDGLAHNLAVTFTTGASNYRIQYFTLSGVDTTVVPLTGSAINGSTATFNIPNCPPNGLAALNAVNSSSTGTTTLLTAYGGGTLTAQNLTGSSPCCSIGYASSIAAGTNTFTATASVAGKFAFTAAVFFPSGAAPPNGPVITSITKSSNNLLLQGTNGLPNGAYQMLYATNLTQAGGTWQDAGANLFDQNGHFSFTTTYPENASGFYRLLVLSPLGVPVITAEPQDRVAFVGQTIHYDVTAGGVVPLRYQWYFNTNTVLPGRTNSTLTLTNVQPADAGKYSVIVSNQFGGVRSRHAQLTTTVDTGGPIGWASLNGGTTGGAGGATVVVTTKTEFQNALNSSSPMVIRLSGMVPAGFVVQGKSNKTIEGVDASSGWSGFIQFKNCQNFIIRNCNIGNSGSDGITIQDSSSNFWVDHCTLGDCGDGQIDIVNGADYVTVSWCKFLYTDANNEHRLSSLIGSGDDNGPVDAGHLRVTFHHNWWSTLCHGRMPRVRFGQVHVFNNYYSIPDHDGYCIVAAWESQLLVENNYFHLVKDPYSVTDGGAGHPGKIKATGNVLDQTQGSVSAGNDTVFNPPYAYVLEDAPTARTNIINGAGNTF